MSNLVEEFPNIDRKYLDEIKNHAEDILESVSFKSNKNFIQHGAVTVYDHVISVAAKCLEMADKSEADIDRKSLTRAALLHDYFLYDWHENDKSHRLHGLHHPKKAALNAKRDFNINELEENAIRGHMWPLGSAIPKSKEAWLVFWADKICAFRETLTERKKK